jgi:hypothetical protein
MKRFVQLLTNNSCFASGTVIAPIGIMLHSTGADNPNLSRYVPGNEEIGFNRGGNHWDQSNAEWKRKFGEPLNKCVHAFIGKLADGSVGMVQTLPWNCRGWHAGMSAGNTRYIGFEICEDGLVDPDYFKATRDAAVELVAELCRMFTLDPLQDGVVICHAEGFKRGIASNHGDVVHWWSKFDYTMDDFRRDVAERMEDDNMTQEKFDEMMDNYLARLAQLPPSEWAEKNLKDAVSLGFTDGTSPRALATREQVALMIRKAMYGN